MSWDGKSLGKKSDNQELGDGCRRYINEKISFIFLIDFVYL